MLTGLTGSIRVLPIHIYIYILLYFVSSRVYHYFMLFYLTTLL